MVTIMDHYGSDFAVLIVACFEVISVMWVYGKLTDTLFKLIITDFGFNLYVLNELFGRD